MRIPSVLIAAAASLLAVVLPTTAAHATPPSDVEITIETTLGEFGGFGPFTAEGPAVDEGLFCESGFSFDVFGKAAGATPQGINFQVIKAFDCGADETVDVIMKLQVRIDRKGNNYSWNVIEAFGDYERLHGTGSGSGEFFEEDFDILDRFDGKMHID